MDDTIRYDYGSNFASLDDIQGRTNDAQALRDEVNKVFTALAGVYEGDAASMLQQKHIEISQMLDNVLNSRRPGMVATSPRTMPRRSTTTWPAASEVVARNCGQRPELRVRTTWPQFRSQTP